MGARPLASLALVAVLAAPALEQPAAAMPSDVPATTGDAAKKKKKKKKAKKRKRCKKNQVRVRSGKKRTCVAARKVLPKPRAGDPRLLAAKTAYKDYSRMRNRRGKRAKSLPKLVRKLGPRARGLLTRVTAQGVAQLDAMIAGASASRTGPRSRRGSPARLAAGGCSEIPKGASDQKSFTSSDGGTSATVTSTLDAEGASIGIELNGNGFTIKADLDFGACEPNEVEAPQCATAAGRLQGELRYKLRVAISVSKGGKDVWSQAMNTTRTTKLDGFTDVDAKFDDLDISDEEVSNINLGGSVRGYPPIGIRTRLIRNTRVNMRTGDYEPGLSDITVTVTVDGLYGADRSEIQDDLERKGRADSESQFRAIVEKAISGYRSRESAWQQANSCAKLQFTPASNALRLSAGNAGSFTTIATAVSDGGSSELDARVSNAVNGTFTPSRAGGQQARFDYTVAGSPSGSKVTVNVRATSKAGVAEGTWEQPLSDPFYIDAIAGTFSGSSRHHVPSTGFDSRFNWSGNVTFVKQFAAFPGATGGWIPVDGTVTYTASGTWHLGGADCQQSGSDSFEITEDRGGLTVFPTGPDANVKGPHDYSGDISFTEEMTITLHSCVEGAEEYEGTQQTTYVGNQAFYTNSQQSPDGVDYSGDHVESTSGGGTTVTYTWDWALTGSED